jgi:hypothetical protein
MIDIGPGLAIPLIVLPALLGEVDQLKTRLAEVEERLDFAERLLARRESTEQLPGGVR